MTAGSRIGFNYNVRIYLNEQAGFEFPPPPFGVGDQPMSVVIDDLNQDGNPDVAVDAPTDTLANPRTYTGREFDTESGLYFFQARYYDARPGGFLNEDPLGFGGGDKNLYRYVFNIPGNLVDSDGRQAVVSRPFIGGHAVGEGAIAAFIAAPVPCAVVVGGAVVVVGIGIGMLALSDSVDDDDYIPGPGDRGRG